jgi:hypothetical protein
LGVIQIFADGQFALALMFQHTLVHK